MKLRTFLSTVPMAAMALALPAKAEPRYVAAMDPCADEPKPRSSFRSWEVDYNMGEITFKTVERIENEDYMCAETRMFREAPTAAAEVARLHHACERWTCRLGENPLCPP